MRQPLDHHQKRVAMFVAVGGTTAVIGALWLLVLPMQLDGATRLGAARAARWGNADDAGPKTERTFTQIIEEQKMQLQRLEAERETTPEGEESANGPADLLTKIEAATVAKATTSAK
jgi:hypothetical protein